MVVLGWSGLQTALGVPVSLSQLGVPYVQDFNSLAGSGTSSILPIGWAFNESGINANGFYTAGTGSSNTGDIYSFGLANSDDRALGGVRSANLVPLFGAEFRNDTGATIATLSIHYWGEQWRLGNSGRADRLDFQYSLGASSLTSGTWADADALDFVSPSTTGSAGTRDGNHPDNRTMLAATVPLAVPPGATFWLRWVDFDASGADDGLAVDDFSLTAFGAAAPNPVPETGRTFTLCLAGLMLMRLWAGKVPGRWPQQGA